jgi:hypothetical protein
LDPDLLAYIGLNVAFTGVSASWDVRRITKAIGSAIEEIHAARSHTGKADAAGGHS